MASVHERFDRRGRRAGWQAKWRDPETGRQRGKVFKRKDDAVKYGVKMEASILEGAYVLPNKVTFRSYAERWREAQVHRSATAEQIRGLFSLHVYPVIGDRALSTIRPSEIQAFVKGLSAELAPATVRVIHRWVGTVFKAAVRDRLIGTSPCIGVNLPEVMRARVAPLEADKVAALAAAVSDRYRAVVILGAGSGVRISEALALTVDRVDWLRRTITIDRQLVRAPGSRPTFGPVKDRRNRPRAIPVGSVVLDALAAHIAAYGTGPEGLIFTTARGAKVGQAVWGAAWRRAAGPLGIDTGDGYHQLRHYYASVLIASGASVKVVQERLGHTSAAMTLDVYSHLFPSDDDHTRDATDAALAGLPAVSCSRVVPALERSGT